MLLAQTNTPSSVVIDLTGIDDTTTPAAAPSTEPVLQLLHVQPKIEESKTAVKEG